ncbi:MAG: threonine--tRNA ligase [Proteobacteria bacterium]|nr:threonine--tRNA ligase [Pseudomonadota bacterium]
MDKINIKLPDGSTKQLPHNSNGLDLAKSIGERLANDSIAVLVNGTQQDLLDQLNDSDEVSIITKNTPEGLEIMRHTVTAQVLASAIKNLYPKAQLAIGPTIDNGFYYDFLSPETISIDDLPKIEQEMMNIINGGSNITKTLHTKQSAIKEFTDINEPFKAEIIAESKQIDNFQIYLQEESGFIDLCRGPHLRSLKQIGHFKLTKVSGAYWKGDANNTMLTRIYGTAWNTKKELDAYLKQIEDAELRDHRKIGKELKLFHFQDDAPGMVFWHPDGWKIYTELERYIRKMQSNYNYQEIKTPQVVDRKLWEKSGHWDKYRENMFITEIDEQHANDKRTNALKPMNCPCHVQIYNHDLRSYRDLPLRLAEFGSCHRYEASGTMHGLMRVRGFTQDDGHIFCTEDQIMHETENFIELLSKIYSDLGFNNFDIKLSTRPENRVGSDEIWDKAEKSLEDAIKHLGLNYEIDEGDGAFYGPKLDFVLTDAIGRKWQCGTFQADFNLPTRLDATYIGEDGNKHVPVMMHRAILGSFERFIGILTENYSGNFPLWLTPIQVVICTITSEADEYAKSLSESLISNNIRVQVDTRNEQISYKIREHSELKRPIIIALGKNEVSNQTVSIRRLGSTNTVSQNMNDFVISILEETKSPLD